MCESLRRSVCALIGLTTVCVLIGPSRGLAQALPAPVSSEHAALVQGNAAGDGMATDARRPFDAASLARAVGSELRRQAAQPGQGSATEAPKKRNPWKSVLIGAGVGAVAGGVLAASSGTCDGPDFGGGCGMVGASGAGTVLGIGVIVGAVFGAGVGAIVHLLIK